MYPEMFTSTSATKANAEENSVPDSVKSLKRGTATAPPAKRQQCAENRAGLPSPVALTPGARALSRGPAAAPRGGRHRQHLRKRVQRDSVASHTRCRSRGWWVRERDCHSLLPKHGPVSKRHVLPLSALCPDLPSSAPVTPGQGPGVLCVPAPAAS